MSKQDQLGQSVWKGVGEMPRLCHVMPGADIFSPPSPIFGLGHSLRRQGCDPSHPPVVPESFIQHIFDKHLLKEQQWC